MSDQCRTKMINISIHTFGEGDDNGAWLERLCGLAEPLHELVVEAGRVREHHVAVRPVEVQQRALVHLRVVVLSERQHLLEFLVVPGEMRKREREKRTMVKLLISREGNTYLSTMTAA